MQHSYVVTPNVVTETLEFQYLPTDGPYFSEDLTWGSVYCSPPSVLDWPDRIAVDSGRVYYKNEMGWDTTAQLLYDFNLQVGDTAYIDWNGQAALVQVADTVAVAGSSTRHLILSNNDEWYECMGSVHGLFRPCCYAYFEDDFTLDHFVGYYLDPDSTEFQIDWPFDVGLNDASGAESLIRPNPATGSVVIHGARPGSLFQLRDMHGRSVLVESLLSEECVVPLVAMAPGIYFAEVGTLRTRLVIE